MADPRLIASISGLTKASWGTGSAADTCAHGFIHKVTLRRAGEDDKVFDGKGFTIGVVFFDDADEVDIEILAKDAAALPARGDTLAVGEAATGTVTMVPPDSGADTDLTGYKGIIFDSEKSWEYKGWKKITCKASQFVNLAYPAS